MNPSTESTANDREVLQRIENGLRLVTVPFPHFAGLVRTVRVSLDERVPTMGIFASGRLVANPRFVSQLKENELIFVLAHEIFHLALRTHDRAVGSDPVRFNYAHDYIILPFLGIFLTMVVEGGSTGVRSSGNGTGHECVHDDDPGAQAAGEVPPQGQGCADL